MSSDVRPSLSRRFSRLGRASNRAPTTSSAPFLAAMCRGVLPSAPFASGSAPAPNSNKHPHAQLERGYSSLTATSGYKTATQAHRNRNTAPAASSAFNAVSLPPCAAWCKGQNSNRGATSRSLHNGYVHPSYTPSLPGTHATKRRPHPPPTWPRLPLTARPRARCAPPTPRSAELYSRARLWRSRPLRSLEAPPPPPDALAPPPHAARSGRCADSSAGMIERRGFRLPGGNVCGLIQPAPTAWGSRPRPPGRQGGRAEAVALRSSSRRPADESRSSLGSRT
eukprot:1734158-Pyramimonas_sp.AAC.1